MGLGKVPTSVENCEDKPKFWDDDMKMEAWFAPFRKRDVNPLNYDNKLNFWKNNVEYFCDKTRKFNLTLSQVREFFARNGKYPHCLPVVFENLLNEGTIQELSEYEMFLSNTTWSGWAVNKLINSPTKWFSKKMVATVSKTTNCEIEETVEYIHLPSLKKSARDLYQCVIEEFKDSIVTYDIVKDIFSKHINAPADLNMIKRLVQWLQLEKKVDIKFEDKHSHVHLLKFTPNSKSVVTITDSEVSVYVLQTQEKLLSNRLRDLEVEEKKLTTEVKNNLKTGQKNTARCVLRKKKEVEKRIEKVLKSLDNVQTLLYRVEETESDSKILDSYKIGANALKSGIANGNLSLTNVDNTMDEVEEVLNMHADMQETLGQVVGIQFNEAELEEELSELLMNDLPSIPPNSPTGIRDTSLRDLDLPEVPRGRFESVEKQTTIDL